MAIILVQGVMQEIIKRVMATITEIKTSPAKPHKYQVGKFYEIEIGNHLILMKCIFRNRGLFFFKDIKELD